MIGVIKMIEEIIEYRVSDGTKFETEEDAKEYLAEKVQKFLDNKFTRDFPNSLTTLTLKREFILSIAGNYDAVKSLLLYLQEII
jgi:cytoplasmic iron level regulating protein YaaA (DUF328/UPF0246 family)